MSDKSDDQTNEPDDIRKLRQKAKRVDELEKEIRDLRKFKVVSEVGLNTRDKFVKLFLDKYDGELTVEALRDAAGEYDLLPKEDESDDGDEPDVGEDESQEDESEKDAHERIKNASGGGSDHGGDVEKPWQKARTMEEFMELYDGRVNE